LLGSAEWAGKIYSGGWVAGSGGMYASVAPATGERLGDVGAAGPGDVRRAVQLARQAQPGWAATAYDRRSAVLRRAADLMEEHEDELARWAVREAGIPRYWSGVGGPAEEFRQAATLAGAPLGRVLPSSQPRLSLTRRVPVGVVGVIAPFNAPAMLAVRALAPALALGNAVVLKPDPRTAVCGGVLIARLLEDAGLPPDLLHVLPGGADVGRDLVTDPDVPVIAFTGSVAAGREVAKLAAPLLKRVHLELGGNSAIVVLDDADLELAVRAGSFGSFHHAGQVCMAASRHLVAAPIADEYTALLGQRAEHLRIGDPAEQDVAYGPLIDEAARDRVHAVVRDSVAAGARLVTGGSYHRLYYQPTVLADVPLSARAYQEEIFGPVAPVVAFRDVDEAARLAAGTEYGLSLAVLTRDVMRGLALASRVPVGMVHINDQTSTDEPIAPFGGMRLSGNGFRIGGADANIEAFTETQWITVNQEPAGYPF
ncbi:MAG TPA: aldehyde dehydrogenase family protein, partial [Actinoplanes sp.]|nr:aldehyde dehydrogenase family protein [Actinoplanes sp.]